MGMLSRRKNYNLIKLVALGVAVWVAAGWYFSGGKSDDRNYFQHKERDDKVINKGSFEKSPEKFLQPHHAVEVPHNRESLGEGYEDPPDLPYDPNAPGEQGKAFVVDKNKLNPTELKEYNEGWKNNAFNNYASDRISLHRSLPDVRDPECKAIQYDRDLPDTSVIVCFHNEAWSVLLRTIHSIIDRSPRRYLREILLVDDYSDKAQLKQPLDEYVAKLPVSVRVLRTKRREGLIRARLMGAGAAKGEVLTFLDSHCECARGWLPPILQRIKDSYRNVVTPLIEIVTDDNFEFKFTRARDTQVGGFDWGLIFTWHPPPASEMNRRKSVADPVRSPTMAGGLFSISRTYFEELGTYDSGMDIWGGENLEISFRIWMCGGTLEILPCSHVGHIFRKRSPYKWLTGVNVVKKNSIRLAEVWLDDYKKYYYERFNYDLGEYGDVSQRKQLRQRLQCKSFKWFLDNIYPELFVPGDSVAAGSIQSKAQSMCVDAAVDHNNMNKPVKMWPCHNQGGNQYWMMSKSGELRRDEGCLDYSGGKTVNTYTCHGMMGNQEWIYRPDNTLLHKNSGRCMEISADGQQLLMNPCSSGNIRQQWSFRRKKPDQHQ